MLGHGPLVAALGAGEANAGCADRGLVELVRAGADRLDEAQLRQARQHVVAPQTGDDEHIGFRCPLTQFVEAADLEAPSGAAARQELVTKLIGGVSEADRQVAFRRQECHALSLPDSLYGRR